MSSLLPRRDPKKNYFPMPNEIFSMGLSAEEIAVYAYLMYRENRKSFQCWPSFNTIGNALRMSKNTVRKYVQQLKDKGPAGRAAQRKSPLPAAAHAGAHCGTAGPGVGTGQTDDGECQAGEAPGAAPGGCFRGISAVTGGKQDIARRHRAWHISRQSRLLRGFQEL